MSFGRKTPAPAQEIVISLGQACCLAGFDVTVVTDPQNQHHSKGASHTPVADQQQALLNVKFFKTKIAINKLQLRTTVYFDNMANNPQEEHAKLVKNLKLAKQLINQGDINVWDILFKQVKELANQHNEIHANSNTIVVFKEPSKQTPLWPSH